MADDKPTTLLLPSAIREISQKFPQRRRLEKLVIGAVVATAIYCLSAVVTSSSPHQYIQNVFVGSATKPPPQSSWEEALAAQQKPFTTTARPWRAGSTMRAAKGPPQKHFRQPRETVVVAREGDDVQLDCLVAKTPHAIVTWYKNSSTFLTMGKRTYVDDDRIEILANFKKRNWALRIHGITLEDAARYSCHLALASDDIVTVTLDVLPRDESSTAPSVASYPVSELFTPGWSLLPAADVCPRQGAGISTVVAVLTHPLYYSTRQRVRHTWAVGTRGTRLAVVFGMGKINSFIMANVTAEAKASPDLVVGNYSDISVDENVNTFKLLSLMQWVVEHCPQANHTLFVTHDQFVNLQKLDSVLAGVAADTPAVRGHCATNRTVSHDPNDRYYMPHVTYPASALPQYCRRPTFLMSRSAVAGLYEAALTQRPIPHADILVTGLAAEAAGVQRLHLPEIYKAGQRVETCEYDGYVTGSTWGAVVDRKVLQRIADKETCPEG